MQHHPTDCCRNRRVWKFSLTHLTLFTGCIRISVADSSSPDPAPAEYLALSTTAHPSCPKPLAVLSVYGMCDPASERYIKPGQALVTPVEDMRTSLQEIDAATKDGHLIDAYPFPSTPATDKRHRWIRALHEGAQYPDVLTRVPGLANQIANQGVSVVPDEFRPLFPMSFGLKEGFPQTVLVHGDADVLIGFEQSASAAEKMASIGIDVHLERVPAQGHGFEAKTFIDLDAGDAQGDDVGMKESLRRVIKKLEKACR